MKYKVGDHIIIRDNIHTRHNFSELIGTGYIIKDVFKKVNDTSCTGLGCESCTTTGLYYLEYGRTAALCDKDVTKVKPIKVGICSRSFR